MKFEEIPLHSFGNTIQIVGGIWQGEGKTFLIFFPKDKADSLIEKLELSEEEWEIFLRQTDLLETQILTKASDGKLVKAVIRKSTRQIEQNISWSVFRRDSYACRYCGANDVPLTVDHLVCWEDGGPSIVDNLVSACRKCNRVRGNTSYEDWLKHEYYLNVSRKLPPSIRELNNKIASNLPLIPRMYHQRSR